MAWLLGLKVLRSRIFREADVLGAWIVSVRYVYWSMLVGERQKIETEFELAVEYKLWAYQKVKVYA